MSGIEHETMEKMRELRSFQIAELRSFQIAEMDALNPFFYNNYIIELTSIFKLTPLFCSVYQKMLCLFLNSFSSLPLFHFRNDIEVNANKIVCSW